MKGGDQNWKWLDRTLLPTRWSMIARARQGVAATSFRDREDFCRSYWEPLYAYLRHSGYPRADAQDHVQSFLASFLERNMLASADPEKGRLRSYLITLLNRHVSQERRRAGAKKRGGNVLHVRMDATFDETAVRGGPRSGMTPEGAFRRAFASQLVAEGIVALRVHYANSGRSQLLEELLPALEGPPDDETYEHLALRLKMRAPAVRTAVVRMRERFRLAVKQSASRLLGLPDGPQLDAELQDIFCGSDRV